MKNREVAEVLYEIADLLEIKGVEWKPRAYREAAQNIESMADDIEEIYKNGELNTIPGVGSGIAKKISEFIDTGKLRYLDRLKKQIPQIVADLIEVPDIGPKTAKIIYKKLKIKNLSDLRKAIKENKISKIRGLGSKTEDAIEKGIKNLKTSKRSLLGYILPEAREIENSLRKLKEVKKVNLAGSIRRGLETVHDVDILIASNHPARVIDYFTNMKVVKNVISKGSTKSSVKLRDNLQVDLRVVNLSSYGSALQYFTGSKSHSIELRKIAMKSKLKLSEYGVFRGEKQVAGKTEKEVYGKLGLKYIEPELRENNGEIKAAQKGKLPRLVKLVDIKGDLHIHSNWSEGNNSILEMVRGAIKRDYSYLAITDHSKTSAIAGGLKTDILLKQIKEVKRIDKKFKNIKVFTGNEVNILGDGSLDYDDNVLKKLDIVIGAVHSGFKINERKMTDRIIRALENKYVKILSHPTGRLVNKREPYSINFDQILEVAKEKNKILEINSFPDRLDLKDVYIKEAIEKGVKLVINTDSHDLGHLRYMELGVMQARRGWAEKKDIVNTFNLKKIKRIFGVS